MMQKSLIVLASFLLTACGASSEASSEASIEAAVSSTPVEGSCFNYTEADVDSSSPLDKEVDCLESHTAEIYRVGIWPGDVDPNELSTDETLELGTTVCMPWDGADGAFDYWAFYFPTSQQWAAGDNWIRCDGMVTESEEPLTFKSWTGSLLLGTA